ncbi:hypothetical protein ASPCAL04394 [Aspergillus calidoustus]|uniref:Uncharacterized protein n=1 Tax=Aspergillus calidoustus TaxID=454130 RepID=A0A0U4Z114_ASPCI|nr:hypothetical protein ASPCAL04394 [Aspergillus calidoustus]
MDRADTPTTIKKKTQFSEVTPPHPRPDTHSSYFPPVARPAQCSALLSQLDSQVDLYISPLCHFLRRSVFCPPFTPVNCFLFRSSALLDAGIIVGLGLPLSLGGLFKIGDSCNNIFQKLPDLTVERARICGLDFVRQPLFTSLDSLESGHWHLY